MTPNIVTKKRVADESRGKLATKYVELIRRLDKIMEKDPINGKQIYDRIIVDMQLLIEGATFQKYPIRPSLRLEIPFETEGTQKLFEKTIKKAEKNGFRFSPQIPKLLPKTFKGKYEYVFFELFPGEDIRKLTPKDVEAEMAKEECIPAPWWHAVFIATVDWDTLYLTGIPKTIWFTGEQILYTLDEKEYPCRGVLHTYVNIGIEIEEESHMTSKHAYVGIRTGKTTIV